MARRLFFVDRVHGRECELTGDRAHHLRTVLRVEPGQMFEVSDNQRVYLAEVRTVRKDRVVFRLIEAAPPRLAPVRLVLLPALVKFDRMEMMIEKATELGAGRVTPVTAERCEPGLERAAGRRIERWRRIVLEAAQQARRARLPDLDAPVSFPSALRIPADYRYLLDETGNAPSLLASLPPRRLASDEVALLVGPEGGWTDKERREASAAGWSSVSLGPHILRAETAAIAALALVGCSWGLASVPPRDQ